MHTTKKILGIGLAAVAAITFVPSTHAEDETVTAKREKAFMKADKDKDGSLSKEEFMAIPAKKDKGAKVVSEKAKEADAGAETGTGDNMQ